MKSRLRILANARRAGLCAVAVGASLLFSANFAQAISLYDIVQLSRAGRSDAEIISLIETTQARFVMDTKTVTELKKAGVSERVIQALIQAGPPEEGEQEAAPSPAEGREAPGRPRSESEAWRGYNAPAPGASHDERIGPSARSATGRRSGGAVFSSFPFEETGLGHGTGHDHFALAMAGIPVLVLRSEAGHRSVAERAEAAADHLNQAAKAPGGRFVPVSTPHASVKYELPSGAEEKILDVSRGDVIAYQRRSLGEVSAKRLAAYWAALLNDYSGMLVGEAPSELGPLHLGESLERLQRDLKAANPSGDTFRGVVDHLSAEDKDHLIELATRIPAEFQVPKGGAQP